MIEYEKSREDLLSELANANKKLAIQNEEMGSIEAELFIAINALNIQTEKNKKYRRETIELNKNLFFQVGEQENRSMELIIAIKELFSQKLETEKSASELKLAGLELISQTKARKNREIECNGLLYLLTEKEKQEEALIINSTRKIESQNEKLAALNEELTLLNNEMKIVKGKALKSEKKFKNLVWTMQVGVLLQGPKAEILLSNPKALELLGLTEDQLLGKTSFDPYWHVIHENGTPFPGATHPVPQSIATQQPVRNVIMGVYRPIKHDLIWLLVDAVPQFNADGEVSQVVCTFIDITKSKQADKELLTANLKIEESESKYTTAFKTSPDSININKLDGTYVDINEGFTNLTGYSAKDVIGKTSLKINIWVNPEDRQLLIQELKEKGKVENLESVFRCKDGTQKTALLSASIILIDGESHILSITRDITERKAMENDLKAAKKKAEESDKLKSSFLANMSHEIRTPMNGILGFAELLKVPDLTVIEQQEYISIIEKCGARMLTTINDIIDISKIESGMMNVNMNESNISEQIIYLYDFFKPEVEAKSMTLVYTNCFPSKELIINTDGEKFNSILTNLLKNAIKYSNSGTIELGYTIVETLHATSLQFFVKDQGIGIPQNRLEAVFERFVQSDIGNTRAYEGSGLGLAISKAYVELLGGKIWVESEEGKGSTFYFTLPYNAEHDEITNFPQGDPSEVIQIQVNNLKVLVVEDDETSERLISINVHKFSDVILKARTGYESVEICRDNPDLDLILMDIQIPDMNGYEATRQIRQFNKEVVIIAQTALAMSGDRERAIESGCNDYISKPINKTELIALIQKYFK
jgi:hypothetical protein